MRDVQHEIDGDVSAVGAIDALPTLLRVLCETTGMGFSVVARVTGGKWIACAVHDDIQLGIKPGTQLDLASTLCCEIHASRKPIFIDHASTDPVYRHHSIPKTNEFESYASVPIILANGDYFGNLCSRDPRPAKVSEPRTILMFTRFAQLIADQLDMRNIWAADREALRDAEALGELRELFVAILGHDLRKPSSAMYALGEELEHKSTDSEFRELASRIKMNARRMSMLIDDVLDFAKARLGSGCDVAMCDVGDLDAAFHAVVREVLDCQPDCKIVAHIAVGCAVRCDRGRLQQVAANLLANALTHGAPSGPVSFVAGVEGDRLTIEVWNAGEPIPAGGIDKIFTPFWRHSTARGRQGVGLGLYICAQIVRAHGGTISVTSTTLDGTQISVKIPVTASPPAA